MTPETAYHELMADTVARRDPTFVHQHVVDAYAAQTAAAGDKPIRLTFALVGLYLHLERKFNGRQVQRAHQMLAATQGGWPEFALPAERGALTAVDVLAAAPGPERDAAIERWCAAVWQAYAASHAPLTALLRARDIG